MIRSLLGLSFKKVAKPYRYHIQTHLDFLNEPPMVEAPGKYIRSVLLVATESKRVSNEEPNDKGL